jgi:hypothetical protein
MGRAVLFYLWFYNDFFNISEQKHRMIMNNEQEVTWKEVVAA